MHTKCVHESIKQYECTQYEASYTLNEKLEIREVSVLRKFDDEVFIDGGLATGDQIISSPLPGAVAGMAVTIKSETK